MTILRKIRYFFAIFISLLVLATSQGVVVRLHVCGDHRQMENFPSESISSCHTQKDSDACCSNQENSSPISWIWNSKNSCCSSRTFSLSSSLPTVSFENREDIVIKKQKKNYRINFSFPISSHFIDKKYFNPVIRASFQLIRNLPILMQQFLC